MAKCSARVERVEVFGLPLDLLSFERTVARCVELVEAGRPAQHASLNAAKVLLARREPRLRQALFRADLVTADGMGVVWAARLLGARVPERVAGIDLMGRLLAEAAGRGWPVFFLGAEPVVLDLFERRARQLYPALEVAGRRDGYFRDGASVAREIGRSRARLLFVGMPSPQKELFLAESVGSMGDLLAVGVGGSFDVWAGRVRRAPVWMQRAGLEWAHRLGQEPRRLWRRYLVGNARFAALVLQELLRKKVGRGGSRPGPA
jgi:N-acetylglucosaminyldiphosphoundecaprenol N-acetyl-beta-D-mannosaminyltransferase